MSPKLTAYLEFLRSKLPTAELAGIEPPSACHPSLKPHQREICEWAIRGGRRAVFAQFGLGKSRINLQLAAWVIEAAAGRAGLAGKFLIVAPLGVRHQFTLEDGPAMGLTVEYVRTMEEARAATASILITNYERVRDGDLDPQTFAGASLDEASCLRSFGSGIYQTFLTKFTGVPFRFVFTATPSPNRFKELIHYAGFLGVMDTGEALTRFFARDSSQAGNLTLYPHMEATFWRWMMTWAVFIQSPADLGHDATGYDLPPVTVHWHRLEIDHTAQWSAEGAHMDSWGQGQLFVDQSAGLKEAAEVKRESITLRLERALEIIREGGMQAPPPRNPEERVIDAALSCVENHYVLRQLKAGASWSEAFGVGGGTLPDWTGWDGNGKGLTYQPRGGGKKAIPITAIKARADQWTERHFLLWHDLEAERAAIEKAIPEAVTVWGSMDLEERERRIQDFSHGRSRILATKPVLAGSGCNFQHHCSDAIFIGVGYKFNDFIQAFHRIVRFLQARPVNIHIIHLDTEDSIRAELEAKWRRHDELVAVMTDLLRQHRLTPDSADILRRTIGVEREERRAA